MMHPMDYLTTHMANYEEPQVAYTSIPVLQFLNGTPWNYLALGYVNALRPSCIRVSTGEVTTDSVRWRVTVFIGEYQKPSGILACIHSNPMCNKCKTVEPMIRHIEQEVCVGVYPKDFDYGKAGACGAGVDWAFQKLAGFSHHDDIFVNVRELAHKADKVFNLLGSDVSPTLKFELMEDWNKYKKNRLRHLF